MLALAERLPRDQFRVDFLAMSGPGPYDERALAAGAGLRYIGSPPRVAASTLERIVGRGVKTVRYAYVARAGRYDIVDAWLYPVDVMAVLARSITRRLVSNTRSERLTGGRGRIGVVFAALVGDADRDPGRIRDRVARWWP